MIKSLGRLTFLGMMAGLVLAGRMAWASRGDVQRYLRIREM
jgi:hypothetical protein